MPITTFLHRRGSVSNAPSAAKCEGVKRRPSTKTAVDVADVHTAVDVAGRAKKRTTRVALKGKTVSDDKSITQKRRQSMMRAVLGDISNAGENQTTTVTQNDAKRLRKGSLAKGHRVVSRSHTTDNDATMDVRPKESSKDVVLIKHAKRKSVRRGSTMEEAFDMTTLAAAMDEIVTEPPEGVDNIDNRNTDPLAKSVYAAEVIRYLKVIEQKFRINANYLKLRKNISSRTRAILVDWLIQVQQHLGLHQETLHLSITLLDLYLERRAISVEYLQLLGTTCLFVACKYEERFTPSIKKLISLTADSYKYKEVINMEQKILITMKFCLYMPTPCVFLERLLQVAQPGAHSKMENLARYLLDLSLQDSGIIHYLPSLKAAAATCFALKITSSVKNDVHTGGDTAPDPVPDGIWNKSLEFYSTYKEEDLQKCMHRYASTLLTTEKAKLKGARDKYASRSKFGAISLWPELQTSAVIKAAASRPSF